jgi:hypothetical protein
MDAKMRGIEYSDLVKIRDMSGDTCTPEQQAGEYAGMCPKCNRKTLHQHIHVCMNCGEEK